MSTDHLADDCARNWREDEADTDNGRYLHTCRDCSLLFVGHKHRPPVCHLCHQKAAATAKVRADWLHEHNAPHDWTIHSIGEIEEAYTEAIKLALDLERERRLRREVQKSLDALKELWDDCALLSNGRLGHRHVTSAIDHLILLAKGPDEEKSPLTQAPSP